jgi:6,7-dimethyl-8-ribityllumazine synthase
MSLAIPRANPVDGTTLRFGIAAARFNEALVDTLLAAVCDGLRGAGARAKNITVVRVPGSHEVPWAVHQLASTRVDCVIALGVLIGGDTNHHDLVGRSVSQALQHTALNTGVPVINGVIVTDTLVQARARCTGRRARGAEFARAALEMASLRRRFNRGKKS